MKAALGNGWKWLLGIFMSLLGFAGCGKLGIFRTEYGCPSADFKLVGDVKDAKGKGIEGIRVVFKPYPLEQNEGNHHMYDTLYSDAQGHFEKERLKYDWPDNLEEASIEFEDVDGSAHGAFKTKELKRGELTLDQTTKGDKHWYSGEYTIKADAVLEEDN